MSALCQKNAAKIWPTSLNQRDLKYSSWVWKHFKRPTAAFSCFKGGQAQREGWELEPSVTESVTISNQDSTTLPQYLMECIRPGRFYPGTFSARDSGLGEFRQKIRFGKPGISHQAYRPGGQLSGMVNFCTGGGLCRAWFRVQCVCLNPEVTPYSSTGMRIRVGCCVLKP